jgi:hypothetical protein
MMLKLRHLQFRLHSLFILMLVASIALWWWFRPTTIEERWGVASGLRLQYTTQRKWNARRYYVGPVVLRYENGNVAAKGNLDGIAHHSITFFVGDDQFQYWHEDGRKLTWKEWFSYVSTDYLPRKWNGEAILTEENWRRIPGDDEKNSGSSSAAVVPESSNQTRKSAVDVPR